MAVNTTIESLSQTAAANGPDGATDPPASLDDAIRYSLSFIAKLRDGAGFAVDAVKTALGFSPVQQGTGVGQLANAVKIGWGSDSQLRLTIDTTDFGKTWPMDIGGSSAQLGGAPRGTFVERGTANAFKLAWDGAQTLVTVDGSLQAVYTTWAAVNGRPTNLSQFTNDANYVVRYGANTVDVGAPDNSGFVGRAIPCTDARVGYINGGSGGMVARVDGSLWYWPISPSDARLKENVAPTGEDSLSKVARISFKTFAFNKVVPSLAGVRRKLGAIAQELEVIDPEWSTHQGDYLQLNTEALLMAALQSIQQLRARVIALEGRP